MARRSLARGNADPRLHIPYPASAITRLADLIDLEAQLARDRDAPPGALEVRDRALLAATPDEDDGRTPYDAGSSRCGSGSRASSSPGARSRALSAVRLALAALGLTLGWGAAAAVLRYTGEHPVNVWDVLLVLVGIQVLLLLTLVAALAFPVATLGAPLLGVFREGVRALYGRVAARGAGPERAEEWHALWHRLRSRRSLYHHVEPWLLLGATQTFGVAFNVGALLGCLRLVVFSDVASAWSTTLVDLDAARFHALVTALARPWAWLWPDAVPSLALVEATRYSRLEGAYVQHAGGGRAVDPALVGGWWRYLLAAIAAYGLLPRALALAVARLRAARLLARLPLDDAEISRLAQRLAEPHVETRAIAPEPEPARTSTGGVAAAAPAEGMRCAVVPGETCPRGRTCVRRSHVTCGARSRPCTPPEDATIWARRAGPRRWTRRSRWSWWPRDSRRQTGPRCGSSASCAARSARAGTFVLVVDGPEGRVGPPADASVRTWREGLAPLEDPYLAVEPLRGRHERRRPALRGGRPREQGQVEHRRDARGGRHGPHRRAPRDDHRGPRVPGPRTAGRCSCSSTRPASRTRRARSPGSARASRAPRSGLRGSPSSCTRSRAPRTSWRSAASSRRSSPARACFTSSTARTRTAPTTRRRWRSSAGPAGRGWRS